MGYTRNKASSILAADFNAGVYIGLSSTKPDGDGGNFTEPAASTGYERKKLEELDKSIKAQIANDAIIFFDESVEAYKASELFAPVVDCIKPISEYPDY